MLSKMYKHLAAFKVEQVANNDNLDRVCKMLWRRIKCLEISLPFLDPEADIIQVQEVTFELADIYLDLLEMKQKKFERTAGNLDPTLLKKMVMICVNRWHCLKNIILFFKSKLSRTNALHLANFIFLAYYNSIINLLYFLKQNQTYLETSKHIQ